MTRFKFLKELKDKAKNPNAIKLMKEIERLFEIGNEARANVLLKRYKHRYANFEMIINNILKKAEEYPDFTTKEYGLGYELGYSDAENKTLPWWGVDTLKNEPGWKDYFREYPNLKYDVDDYADRDIHEPEMNNGLEYRKMDLPYNDIGDKRFIDDWVVKR